MNTRSSGHGQKEEGEQSCGYKDLWAVKCGTKEGTMDVKKLEKSMECIECEGHQFTPQAFEEFSGKGSSKKWKCTIYANQKPLKHWIEKGELKTNGFKNKRVKNKKQRFQNNKDESADNLGTDDSPGRCEVKEVTEADLTEDTEDEDVSEIRSVHNPWVIEMEKETEMEDDGDALDNPQDLSPPNGPDPRLIISTPEKLRLQIMTTAILDKMSMKITNCQTTSEEHPQEDEQKRDQDSEMNCCKKEIDCTRAELLHVSVPEDSEEPVEAKTVDVSTNTTVKDEMSSSVAVELVCSSVESQIISETRNINSPRLSAEVETSPSGVLAASDLDNMEMDKLKRETLKMQLEASRVQKEYYTLKLHKLKPKMGTA